jgi:nanoRNase/pAp phosphatase (c-di-AMP/oligoRNAs hydrolase)
MEKAEVQAIKDILTQSNRVLLVTRERPSVDGLSAALALAETLKVLQKTVTVACSGQLPEEAKTIPGIEGLQTEVKPTNLVISFDYVEGMVEKVSYNIEGDQFNLILAGRDKVLDPNKIKIKNSGADYDLIIFLDTPKIEYLGKLFETEKEIFSKIPTLNIDFHQNNTGYATYNWVNTAEGSTTEVVFDIITNLEFGLLKKAADLMLIGIKAATLNFTKNVKAETMERAAACMRAQGQVENTQDAPPTPDESWFAPKIYRSSKIIE